MECIYVSTCKSFDKRENWSLKRFSHDLLVNGDMYLMGMQQTGKTNMQTRNLQSGNLKQKCCICILISSSRKPLQIAIGIKRYLLYCIFIKLLKPSGSTIRHNYFNKILQQWYNSVLCRMTNIERIWCRYLHYHCIQQLYLWLCMMVV